MTPEQEAKFERLLVDLSQQVGALRRETELNRKELDTFRTDVNGRVASLGRSMVETRSRLETSQRTLSEAVISWRETLREDSKLQFETLQNMFEQLRTEVLGCVGTAREAIEGRLGDIKSDLHHLVQVDSALSMRIDSALEMGLQRAKDVQEVREMLQQIDDRTAQLWRGVAATYDRAGRGQAAAEVGHDQAEPAASENRR